MSERVDVERLERLLREATPGPWQAVSDFTLATVAGRQTYRVSPQYTDRGGMSGEDAALIVAMHASLPALLAVARAAGRVVTPSEGMSSQPDCRCGCIDALRAALAALDLHAAADTDGEPT